MKYKCKNCSYLFKSPERILNCPRCDKIELIRRQDDDIDFDAPALAPAPKAVTSILKPTMKVNPSVKPK